MVGPPDNAHTDRQHVRGPCRSHGPPGSHRYQGEGAAGNPFREGELGFLSRTQPTRGAFTRAKAISDGFRIQRATAKHRDRLMRMKKLVTLPTKEEARKIRQVEYVVRLRVSIENLRRKSGIGFVTGARDSVTHSVAVERRHAVSSAQAITTPAIAPNPVPAGLSA